MRLLYSRMIRSYSSTGTQSIEILPEVRMIPPQATISGRDSIKSYCIWRRRGTIMSSWSSSATYLPRAMSTPRLNVPEKSWGQRSYRIRGSWYVLTISAVSSLEPSSISNSSKSLKVWANTLSMVSRIKAAEL